MSISIKEISTRKELKEYIRLPEIIYRGDSHWVPPIYADEWSFHDPKKNSALQYSETIRLFAYRDGKAIGRIMGIINKKYNEQKGEKTARFFNLDCVNNQAVAHELISQVESWAA